MLQCQQKNACSEVKRSCYGSRQAGFESAAMWKSLKLTSLPEQKLLFVRRFRHGVECRVLVKAEIHELRGVATGDGRRSV